MFESAAMEKAGPSQGRRGRHDARQPLESRRHRLEVVGWARLHGKGPPPRPGPLNRGPMPVDPHGHEPSDEDIWAEQDATASDEQRVAEVARRAEQLERRGVPTSIALASLPLSKRPWDHRVRMWSECALFLRPRPGSDIWVRLGAMRKAGAQCDRERARGGPSRKHNPMGITAPACRGIIARASRSEHESFWA